MKKDLNVQCFVKKDFPPIFDQNNNPKLLYVSKISADASAHPRIMHMHKHFTEVLIIVSGESDFLIHDRKYHIRAGDLLVYNSEIMHDEISGPDHAVEYYCIAVGGLHMPGLRENALIPDDAGYVFQAGASYQELAELMNMMHRNLSDEAPRCEAFCDSLLRAVLVKTLAVVAKRTETRTEEDRRPEEDSILGQRIKKYIDENYMESMSLQTISEALHISSYYIAHVFKEMSGYSPMQYLLRRRIGEAQTLLISTDHSISDIAGMVGYDTQSYFNMQFTKHVGMPPRKYRQTYVVGNENKKKK
ncbi:MAG: AraC family transcriptional regulator [Lachnospiraceae bacterium]|nr:AraC family transcriptional regulator [Lachnospiraceae bacterium]